VSADALPRYADTSRHQPITRLLTLLRLLCHGQHTAAELREALEVSDRTLRRLLAALRRLDVEVERHPPLYSAFGPEPPHRYTVDARNAAEALGLLGD